MLFSKQKTAYAVRLSDWSSYLCSSDLPGPHDRGRHSERPYDHSDGEPVTAELVLDVAGEGGQERTEADEVPERRKGDDEEATGDHPLHGCRRGRRSADEGGIAHRRVQPAREPIPSQPGDRKSTRLNSSH